ncbi:Serine/threonine-protein phosphatase [Spironucleus salmonicida]|uniref:Serine/threonine-protein phosphatase n=1 Tax=Spironucleus salmonicida TaxID=348837 RepID=V6LP51_9EUKA|nr:Serine/threonine-protein phosphatase [Spironucleus salmonicida]|eukprot:EST46457.1 Serine/threonine-protein phosphatase [Spironucleus salmonicida]
MAAELKDQGNKYFLSGDYALSQTLYTQALDIEPESPIILSNRANANFMLGDFLPAEQDALKAVQIDPQYVKGYWRLAEIYSCTTKQQQALEMYRKAHDILPNNKKIALALTSAIQVVGRSKAPNLLKGLSDIPVRNLNDFIKYQNANNQLANPYTANSTGPESVNEDGRQYRFDIENNIVGLFEELSSGRFLHSQEVFRLIHKAGEVINPLKAVSEFSFNSKLFIIGDIHGSLPDFKQIFNVHIKLNEFDKSDDSILILGDYVDRGDFGHQVVLFFAALKIKYPNRVHMIRGNHETPQMNSFFGYQQQIENNYGTKSGVFSFMTQFFANLPLSYIFTDNISKNRFFACHGGPPVKTEDFMSCIPEKTIEPSDEVSQQLLWNDPNKDGSSGMRPSHRGVGVIFGKDLNSNFCAKYGFQRIFRGHEVVYEAGGVKDDFNDGKHITVFSSSHYMGQGNYGGMALLEAGQEGWKVIKTM